MALQPYRKSTVLRLLPSFISSSQLLVSISAEGIATIYQERGLRARIIEKKYVSFDPAMGALSFQQIASELDSLFAGMQIVPDVELHIILASNFIRYLALPPQQIAMNSAEKAAYAQAAYREIYGAVADDWEIKRDNVPPHHTAIVAAVDKSLLSALVQVSLKQQLKLMAIDPYLMGAFNRVSSQIDKNSDYLVIKEPLRLLLITLSNQQCTAIRAFAVGDDWQAELKRLMIRESFLQENSTRELLIYAPAHQDIALGNIEGWHIKRIDHSYKMQQHKPEFFNHTADFALLEAAL